MYCLLCFAANISLIKIFIQCYLYGDNALFPNNDKNILISLTCIPHIKGVMVEGTWDSSVRTLWVCVVLKCRSH